MNFALINAELKHDSEVTSFGTALQRWNFWGIKRWMAYLHRLLISRFAWKLILAILELWE